MNPLSFSDMAMRMEEDGEAPPAPRHRRGSKKILLREKSRSATLVRAVSAVSEMDLDEFQPNVVVRCLSWVRAWVLLSWRCVRAAAHGAAVSGAVGFVVLLTPARWYAYALGTCGTCAVSAALYVMLPELLGSALSWIITTRALHGAVPLEFRSVRPRARPWPG